MSRKILINCEEANSICNKNQYQEASRWNIVILNIHVLMCKYCKTYSSQNHIISILIGKHMDPCDDANKLTEEEKQLLEKNLIRKMVE
jgi:hypothetical protein